MNKDRKIPFNNTNGDDHEELHRIWELSHSAKSKDQISSDEIENALKKIHSRIENSKNLPSAPSYSYNKYWMHARYLVAAAALIIFAAWYLFTPIHVSVPNGEIAVLELNDGSTVELNSGSELTYSRFFGSLNRDLTLNGEAYFSVQNAATPFRVKANGTVTEVTGTQFNIRSWRNDPGSETVVTVTDGEVEFFSENNIHEKVTLTPGHSSRWGYDMNRPTAADLAAVSDVTGWKENRLIFKDQKLIVILHELERRFDTQIRLEVSGAELETLTAYYSEPKNITAVLEDISTVKGFQFSETANGYRIFK
jgi:transmembrane sensor